MRKLEFYIAASLDGYIAGPDEDLDWLDAGSGGLDYGYREFYDSVDTTLMGNSIYRVALTANKFPYPDKTNYAFTRKTLPPDTDHVRFVSGDIAAFVRTLKNETSSYIWLIGGGQTDTVMLNAGLIDEIILTVFPLVLGGRVSMFSVGAERSLFRMVGCETYETGVIHWPLTRE